MNNTRCDDDVKNSKYIRMCVCVYTTQYNIFINLIHYNTVYVHSNVYMYTEYWVSKGSRLNKFQSKVI